MFILKVDLLQWLKKIQFACRLSFLIVSVFPLANIDRKLLMDELLLVGPDSLGISIIASCFIGIIFTLQIVKEFLYLNISSFIGAVLSTAFIRELSPVLTAVIIIGRIGSSFTAQLAAMKVTEQIDVLYLLKTDPVSYLVFPRLVACTVVLPILNLVFLCTSLASSIFTCCVFYNIHPALFLSSSFSVLSYMDFLKTTLKSTVFGFIISIISCAWGLTTVGGSRNVGQSTTSSVVTSLLSIFLVDFALTYVLFSQSDSVIKSL